MLDSNTGLSVLEFAQHDWRRRRVGSTGESLSRPRLPWNLPSTQHNLARAQQVLFFLSGGDENSGCRHKKAIYIPSYNATAASKLSPSPLSLFLRGAWKRRRDLRQGQHCRCSLGRSGQLRTLVVKSFSGGTKFIAQTSKRSYQLHPGSQDNINKNNQRRLRSS